jgi:hypothetical protein
MQRTKLNFWLDTLLAVLFVILFWVAMVLRFVFPPGPSARGWTLWSATYQQWCDLQFGILVTMAMLILLHVMLHWSWVCGVVASQIARFRRSGKARVDSGTQTIYGVGLIVVIMNVLGLAFAVAYLTVQRPAGF